MLEMDMLCMRRRGTCDETDGEGEQTDGSAWGEAAGVGRPVVVGGDEWSEG